MADYQEYRRRILHRRWRRVFIIVALLALVALLSAIGILWKVLHRERVDTALSQISAVWADLGARENYASLAKNRLSDDATVYTTLMSNNEDVDIAEATTDVSTAQTVYDASLTVGAKAITKTLLDYIV